MRYRLEVNHPVNHRRASPRLPRLVGHAEGPRWGTQRGRGGARSGAEVGHAAGPRWGTQRGR
eukprot:gene10884-biopygen13679